MVVRRRRSACRCAHPEQHIVAAIAEKNSCRPGRTADRAGAAGQRSLPAPPKKKGGGSESWFSQREIGVVAPWRTPDRRRGVGTVGWPPAMNGGRCDENGPARRDWRRACCRGSSPEHEASRARGNVASGTIVVVPFKSDGQTNA